MTKKIDWEETLTVSSKKYDGKFGYEKSVFFGWNEKMEIVCPIHGSFWQTPNKHINGKNGCKACAGKKKRTTEEFNEVGAKIHNGKYKYPDFYVNRNTPIEIICPIHGSFFQRPAEHLSGNGCLNCGHIETHNKQRKPFNLFVNQANEKFSYQYDYSEAEKTYNGNKSYVKVICNIHGSFLVRVIKHLQGCGCPHCGGNSSHAEKEWIRSLNNPKIIPQKKIYLPDNTYIKADGYDPDTNTIYEYNGKYYHGHPDVCNPDEKAGYDNKNRTFGEIYLDTIIKELRLKELGFTVISVWK
jgi:hypothetical protein